MIPAVNGRTFAHSLETCYQDGGGDRYSWGQTPHWVDEQRVRQCE